MSGIIKILPHSDDVPLSPLPRPVSSTRSLPATLMGRSGTQWGQNRIPPPGPADSYLSRGQKWDEMGNYGTPSAVSRPICPAPTDMRHCRNCPRPSRINSRPCTSRHGTSWVKCLGPVGIFGTFAKLPSPPLILSGAKNLNHAAETLSVSEGWHVRTLRWPCRQRPILLT